MELILYAYFFATVCVYNVELQFFDYIILNFKRTTPCPPVSECLRKMRLRLLHIFIFQESVDGML
jgi:hypothetical protein